MSAIPPLLIDDDGITLLHLTKQSDGGQQLQQSSPGEKQEQSLTLNNFQDLSFRFIEDITSPICTKSYDDFWQSLISSLHSHGFVDYLERENRDSDQSDSAPTTPKSTIDFESKEGSAHLDAVVSLLGVSIPHAKTLTSNILQNLVRKSIKQQTSPSPSPNEANSKDSMSTLAQHLLGTKKLLVLVQDYHYEQQLSRIRFIAESLRREKADDENNEYIKSSCKLFLNELDERTIISVSKKSDGYSRGLLKILTCIACAPLKTLDRDELHKGAALFGDDFTIEHDVSKFNAINANQKNRGDSMTQESKSSQQFFARNLMEKHKNHYDSALRTEALEALFMLLYTRIQGGITRGDYMLLLLAFDRQRFYSTYHQQQNGQCVNHSEFCPLVATSAKRRSQLSALILAECMSLWHATNNNGMTSDFSSTNIEWIGTHPFLSGDDSNLIYTEMNLIGNLLFQKHSLRWQALTSKRIAIGANGIISNGMKQASLDMTKNSEEQNLDVEVPESIAMLTFGLILKIAYNSGCSTTPESSGALWASQQIKELATQCVSVANDQCGAFEYLGNIMKNFLHEPISCGELKGKHRLYIDDDWREDMLSQSQKPKQSPKITNDEVKEYLSDSAVEEDGTIISYASIGREILVGTLCAFRSTIRVSNKKNVVTLCELASKIYRNNDAMCANFWSDWTSESQLRDQNTSSASLIDPMCLLLDVAYQIANQAVSNDIEAKGNFDSTSLNYGKFAASILPDLQPILSFISSLISHDGSMVLQILEAFLSNGIIHDIPTSHKINKFIEPICI